MKRIKGITMCTTMMRSSGTASLTLTPYRYDCCSQLVNFEVNILLILGRDWSSSSFSLVESHCCDLLVQQLSVIMRPIILCWLSNFPIKGLNYAKARNYPELLLTLLLLKCIDIHQIALNMWAGMINLLDR